MKKKVPYKRIYKNGKYSFEHREILAEVGADLKGKVVHHINRKHDDNDPLNLAVLTRREHQAVHLIEDGFDIISQKPSKTVTPYMQGLYGKLPNTIKRDPVGAMVGHSVKKPSRPWIGLRYKAKALARKRRSG